jgi:hypothetical protein
VAGRIRNAMAIVEIHVPDELRRRMDEVGDEDWSQIARQAIERRLEQLISLASAARRPSCADGDGEPPGNAAEQRRLANAAYDQGYTWARERAPGRDLRAMVSAPDYRTAVDIVRGTKGFSQRDEFGDSAYPSDEMWEAFVDGATAQYNEGNR